MRCKSRNGSSRMIPSFKGNSATLAECFPKGIPLSTRGGRECLSIKGGCWEIKIHGSEIEIHFSKKEIHLSKKEIHLSKKEIHFSDNKGENHTSLRTACGFLFCASASGLSCQGQAYVSPQNVLYFSAKCPLFLRKTSSISLQYLLYFSAKPPLFLCNTSYIFPQNLLYFSAIHPLSLRNKSLHFRHKSHSRGLKTPPFSRIWHENATTSREMSKFAVTSIKLILNIYIISSESWHANDFSEKYP